MDIKCKVYEYLRQIPVGKVVTYGQIALWLGNKGFARVVGNALHQNTDPEKYPCYKVVNKKGRLSEHYAFGGIAEQRARLQKDGIFVENNTVDLKKYQWVE